MRLTGIVKYSEEVPPAEVVQAVFSSYAKEQDWAYNALPLRSDLWRWNATTQPVHSSSALIASAIQKCANGKFYEIQVTAGAEDFSFTAYMGSPSNPAGVAVEEWTEAFSGTYPSLHVPVGAKSTAGEKSFGLIDTPTGRLVEAVTQPEALPSGGKRKWEFLAAHDFNKGGTGYSPNGSEKPTAIEWPPESGEDKSRSAGGSVTERGGSSAALVCPAHLMIRFPNLYRAYENWEDAIPHPLGLVIQGAKFGTKKGGMAPRGATKFGYGIVESPADGRLPYVFPTHRGEVSENGCTVAEYREYAPPMGCWTRFGWTKAQIEAYPGPAWVKAALYTWKTKGAIFIDVGGAEGMNFRWESPQAYSYRGDTYATTWLAAHEDGTWLKKKEAGWWKFDITGSSATRAKELFEAIEVLEPPSKPADLPS